MIWTVVLKTSESFVIHGSSFDRNTEVRKCLKARNLTDDSVAGIVQGNHRVDEYRYNKGAPAVTIETIQKARQAAMEVPCFESLPVGTDTDTDSNVYVLDKKTEIANDPVEW